MNTQLRPFRRDRDISAMIELATTFPGEDPHVVDLPYRLCSWALDDPDNVALWVDEDDRLVGWAVMQLPFWTIDIAVHPESGLFADALEWAVRYGKRAMGSPQERPQWFVHVFGDQNPRLRGLENAGFACQSDVGEDSWSKVFLQCEVPPTPVQPMDGLVIRPLEGLSEVSDYVETHCAAFGSTNMTEEWRVRTLDAQHYSPSADLVAVAEDGCMAGFCIGWVMPGDPTIGQIEPMGVLPEYREQGLGAALLNECLRRLFDHGAESIRVETDTYRNPALQLYKSLGFQLIRDILVYRKDFGRG
jgi:mycothiol synthase